MTNLLTRTAVAVILLLTAYSASGDEDTERTVQAGVPQGTLKSGTFSDSRIFPGTTRQYSVYVPAQYKPDQPAALMVFMDGASYSKLDGPFRVPTVFDNLIHSGAMPITIAVFVNPGTIPATFNGAQDRSNRSFEYDSLGDAYSKFLIDEFLRLPLRDSMFRPIRRIELSVESHPGPFVHSPSPGNDPISSEKCSAISAAIPTSAVAGLIQV